LYINVEDKTVSSRHVKLKSLILNVFQCFLILIITINIFALFASTPSIGLNYIKANVSNLKWMELAEKDLEIIRISTKLIRKNGVVLNFTYIKFNMIIGEGKTFIYGVLVKRVDLENKVPGIVLVHGWGGSHKSLLSYAEYLASEKFVVLAIDAAGHGKSGLINRPKVLYLTDWDFKNIEYSLLRQVYLSAIRAVSVLTRDSSVDSSKIGICGASMGGLTSLVAGAVDPRIQVVVPVVASGCLLSSIRLGGLSNFLISRNISRFNKYLANVAYIDPVNYVHLMKNKRIYILFSTHDEFFPIEGLLCTLSKTKAGELYLSLAANNNHYREYYGWREYALKFFKHVFYGEDFPKLEYSAVDLELGLYASAKDGVYLEVRPAIQGFPYTRLKPPVFLPYLFPLQYFVELRDSSGRFVVTSAPVKVGSTAATVVLVLSAVLLLLSKRSLKHLLDLFFVVIVTLVYVSPLLYCPSRFTLNILQLTERYGVYTGSLYTTPFLALLSPIVYYLCLLMKNKKEKILLATVYLIVSSAAFIEVSYIISRVLSKVPEQLRPSILILPTFLLNLIPLIYLYAREKKLEKVLGNLKVISRATEKD